NCGRSFLGILRNVGMIDRRSLIWISGHQQMKGIPISNTRTHGKRFGLRTDKTHHGWQQR
ncbi:unnamed protein product, partial [Sphagnum balticum]